MAPRAVIFGVAGPDLGPGERALLAEADPWGFILFARNIEAPGQLRRLTGALRDAVGRDAPVLIDQEGGRVARMRAPHWREWAPALEECARLPSTDLRVRAMRLRARLIAAELRACGIDVNCAPMLDVVGDATHPVIRSRCYGADAAEVAAIGRGVAEGLLCGGVLPVMKHMPGQGRATLDSHLDLPVVDAPAPELDAVDFAPFRALADLPMAMTAHVVYRAIDPERPATQSRPVVRMMREAIGFDGLLMTDDLSMRALDGPFGPRAEAALAAGCDVLLHCNGDRGEMSAVAAAAPELWGRSAERAERALALRPRLAETDTADLEAEFAALGEAARA